LIAEAAVIATLVTNKSLFPLRQSYGKEKRAARNKIPAIVRHPSNSSKIA